MGVQNRWWCISYARSNPLQIGLRKTEKKRPWSFLLPSSITTKNHIFLIRKHLKKKIKLLIKKEETVFKHRCFQVSRTRWDTQPRVLKELAEGILELVAILFKKLWRSEKVLDYWKGKIHPHLYEKEGGGSRGLQSSQPDLDTWKDHGAGPQLIYCEVPKEEQVDQEEPAGFPKGKLCLINWSDEGKVNKNHD